MSVFASARRCADGAEARGDVRTATAPPAARLLLVEQPGPWGRDAVRESRLDRTVAEALIARAADVSARLMLIRRVGRTTTPTVRRWALVDTSPGRATARWGRFRADAELLDIPLDGSAGEPDDAPAYLVCTHGRHDACCAIRGRPVAAAFAAFRPEATWECSHVGGDRFAANVVVLPYGLYYGHVPPAMVAELVRDTEAGLLQPGLLRGRTAYRAPVQAAQHHARIALGERRIDVLEPLTVTDCEGGRWQVTLAHPSGGSLEVVVQAMTTRVDARLTCGATGPGNVHSFPLIAMTQTPRAG